VAVILKNILIFSCVLAATGCGVLNNLDAMRSSMEQMTYYTGLMASNMPVMADSTRRMASTTERMERKSNELVADLQKRGSAIERTIDNISQTSFGYNKETIKKLDGIRTELNEMNKSIGTTGTKAQSGQDQAGVVALQARLNDLEARFAALSSKIDKAIKTP
jgi:hypothetical protein